jgi:GrpB-like predicted nucleotidyltransferase (UPF0157 family)
MESGEPPQGMLLRVYSTRGFYYTADYREAWRLAFSALHGRMSGCLDGFYLAIEYVGSTSIPSLAGKDKVDVDVIMASKLIRIHRAPRCSRDACTHRLTIAALTAP